MGGSWLLSHEQAVWRDGSVAGREIPGGVHADISHHGHALRCRHIHPPESCLELYTLHLWHQVSQI